MREKPHGRQSGFVLVCAVVLLGASMIMVGGAIAYASHATRATAMMTGKSVCRLAAQSSIESAKAEIHDAFARSISKTARRVGFSNSKSYEWFGGGSGTTRTIGQAPNIVTLPLSTNINGCVVKTRIARVVHAAGTSRAEVTLIATASRSNPGGSRSTATIEERIRFSIGRSRVFDNAYFVNNYGWFQGSGCTANGDVRANGDMYLDSGCKVNGRVYAARNDELRVKGDISSYGKMDAWNTYKSTTYGTANRARPLGTGGGQFNPPERVTTSDLIERLHGNEDITVEMPFIGDLTDYVDWSKELHEADSNQGVIRQGGKTLVTCRHSGAGPSGNTANADKGAILLVGTQQNPIEIRGPVVIDSDVVIKGYVKGQGTIYSGRNIHIVGNIQYVNPPQWVNKAETPGNASKDLIGLMAKGNIVLGDCTSSAWHNSVDTYLYKSPYVQKYACDASDADIGYPSTFGGDYRALDGGSKVVATTTRQRNGTTTTTYANQQTRHYYDTVCDNSVISGNATTITRVDAVLYNNHGTFGKIGSCTFNGAIVCRNEGLIYESSLYINWDYRLFSGSAESVDNDAVGLARASDSPPATLAWQEVPDSLNDSD